MADDDWVTVKQISTVVGIIVLVLMCGGVVATKADKADLRACENHMKERVNLIQKELKEDIQEVKHKQDRLEQKQDKMYDLLLEIKRNGNGQRHPGDTSR